VLGLFESIGMLVFEGASPSVNSIQRELNDEHSLCCFAGPKKLQNLGLS
jgi:hypothetical protein